jgi:hypothetical protein
MKSGVPPSAEGASQAIQNGIVPKEKHDRKVRKKYSSPLSDDYASVKRA